MLLFYVFDSNNGPTLKNFRPVRKIAKQEVRPSVRMEQLCSHWKDFHEIWNLNIFKSSVDKMQLSWKSDKNNGYFS